MAFFRKPLHRFVVWALLVVAVAAGAAWAGLSAWLVVGLVFVTWVAVTVLERRIESRAARPAVPADEPRAVPEVETAAPEAPAPDVPGRRRRLRPPLVSSSTPAPAAVAVPRGEKQWSIWALDKAARENTDPELRYLVLSLQEYADADGLLPLQFDPLVRESFGELLGIAAV